MSHWLTRVLNRLAPNPRGRPAGSNRPVAEPLESRILFSADLPWVSLDVATHAPLEPVSEHDTNASCDESAENSAYGGQRFVVVDQSLLDEEQLSGEDVLALLEGSGVEVAILDKSTDGLSELTDLFPGSASIAELHVITTASSDGFAFGSATVGVTELLNDAGQVSDWRDSFSANTVFEVHAAGVERLKDSEHLNELLAMVWGGDARISGFIDMTTFATQVSSDGSVESANADPFDLRGESSEQIRREIVFIDSRVQDYETLLNAIDAQDDSTRVYDVVLIDSDRDGIEQITAALEGFESIDAVHLVSHGDAEGVQLGSTWLDAHTVENYADQLAAWRTLLDDQADFLIYGCDVASGPEGLALLGRLQNLTGADVAASDDKTGHKLLDGDWQLEFSAGQIEASVALSESLQDAWFAALPTNNAPVLGGANDLSSINEGDVSNTGTLVSDLISGQITDSDAGALEGIAVVAVDDANGVWQYTTDGGSNWYSFGAVDESSARLLAADADTRVRFVPDEGYHGTVTNGLTFHAWDQTTGTAGGTASLYSIFTVRDEFTTASYSNNDGTANWASDWSEGSDPGGATGGNVQISGGELRLDNHDNRSLEVISRAADLDGAKLVTLSLDFRAQGGLETNDAVAIEVSSNGGGSWTTLETWDGFTGTTSGSRSYDISAYATADTQIRFRILDGYLGADEFFYVDDVQIEYAVVDTGGSFAYSSATASCSLFVNALPTGSVTIDNTTPAQGDLLTASSTLADPDGLSGSITYQWQRDGVDIAGATGSTYTTVQADVGAVITVVASYTDDLGTDEVVNSSATAAVANVNDPPTGSVTIDNMTPAQGDVLSVSNTLADVDGISGPISYQWQRDGVDIAGETGGTYVILEGDVGSVITVIAIYTDGYGTVEVVSSDPSAPVRAVNMPPVVSTSTSQAVIEGETFVVNIEASDREGGALSYGITGGDDASLLEVDPQSGSLRFGAAPDYESPIDADGDNIYDVVVTVEDRNGGRTDLPLQIAVSDINEAPIVTDAFFAIDDSSGAAVVGSVSAIDPDANDTLTYQIVTGNAQNYFHLDPDTGEIARLGDQVPFGLYSLNVRVIDASGATAEAVIQISVQDADSSDGLPHGQTDAPEPRTSPDSTDSSVPQGEDEQPTGEGSTKDSGDELVFDPAMLVPEDLLLDPTEVYPVAEPVALDASTADSRDQTKTLGQRVSRSSLSARIRMIFGETTAGVELPQFAFSELQQSISGFSFPISPELTQALDELAKNTPAGGAINLRTTGAVVASISLSSGLVVWMLRSGALLASLLSTKPAWSDIDPLAVLAHDAEDEDGLRDAISKTGTTGADD